MYDFLGSSTVLVLLLSVLSGLLRAEMPEPGVSESGRDVAESTASVECGLETGDPPVVFIHGTLTTQTWTKENIYVVDGTAGVAGGHTLTIEPGTLVRFDGRYQLIVDGTLVADGTPDEPIRFTSNHANPAPGDWRRISFQNGSVDATLDSSGTYVSGSIVRYAILEYGDSAVYIDDAGPFIALNRVDKMDSTCCGLSGGSNADVSAGPVIAGNVLTGTGISFNWNIGSLTVVSNTISGAQLSIAQGAGTVAGNSISDVPPDEWHDPRYGLYAHGALDLVANRVISCGIGVVAATSGLISGHYIVNNSSDGLRIIGSPTVLGNTIWLNRGTPVVVDSGGPPVLHYNNLIPQAGQYALVNNTSNDVDATNNWWGVNDEAAVEALIYDGLDEYGRGIVDYSGYLSGPTGGAIHFTFLPSVLRN
jgi:hypothetical protein